MGSRTELRPSLAVVVAMALSCAAFVPVFDQGGWVGPVLGAVLVVVGAGMLARRARVAPALQPAGALLALLAWTCLLFVRPTLTAGLLPNGRSLGALQDLLAAGWLDVEQLAPPVPSTPGLVLLAVLGVGAVTIAVDVLTVVLRRGAVAGLPLLALLAVPSAVLPGGTGAVVFGLAALGWLCLLLADSDERVARWQDPHGAADASLADPGIGRSGRRIGVAALAVALVVPALVPGLQSRLLGSGDGPGFGGARKTTTFNPLLRLSGQLTQEPRELFSYSTTANDPGYLRLTTLDLYSEKDGWSSSELTADVNRDRIVDGIPPPVGVSVPSSAGRAEVTLSLTDRLEGTWLPLPLSLDAVSGVDGPWLWDADADTAFSSRRKLSDVDRPYTAETRTDEPSIAQLRAPQSDVPNEIQDLYGTAPQLTDPVRRELERITANATTPYDKVVALQSWFRGPQFSYDTEAEEPNRDTPDALENFLSRKKGYCEQYASAMGALVRGLGLPARVAVGFTSGTRTPDSYVVSSLDAHAWPEVWFSGVGWVRFEPTPRVEYQPLSVPGYTEPASAPDGGGGASAAPSPTAAAAPVPGQAPAGRDRADEQVATSGGSGGSGPSSWWLVVPALAALLLLVPALVSALRRRARLQHGDPLAAWTVLRDDARDLGHRFSGRDSPRAAARRLEHQTGLSAPAAAALHELAGAAEQARYGRGGAGVRPRPGTVREQTACVRSGMRAHAGRRQRLRAVLLPASTLTWVSQGAGVAVTRGQDRVEALASSTATRVSSVRLRRGT